MFAQVRDVRSDRDVSDDAETGKIDDREGAVGSRDVGVHVEVGAQERRAMLVEEEDAGGDEEDHEGEVQAWVFGVGHEVS